MFSVSIRTSLIYKPVSSMVPGGFVPTSTTKYEKRGVAEKIPVWKPDLCTQCNYCSLTCPHVTTS